MTRSVTAPLRWLLGARLRRTYLAFGNASGLRRHLVFHSGLRAVLERLAVPVLGAFWAPAVNATDAAVQGAWDDVWRALEPSAAMLLYTGWYKQTVFVGPVATQDGLVFVKVFTREQDALAEESKAREAERMLKGYFTCASVRLRRGHLVAYELREHGPVPVDTDAVRSGLLALGAGQLASATQAAPLGEFVDVDRLCARMDATAAAAKLRAATLSQGRLAAPLPRPVVHGDFTPWNMFVDVRGCTCVVDYERVGAGSPFFDAFHFHSQPLAMQGPYAFPRELLQDISARASVTPADAAAWYAAYLSQQLQENLSQWHDHGRRHHQLASAISAQQTQLAAALDFMNA